MTVFFPNCSSTNFFAVSPQPMSTLIPSPSSTPSPTPAQIPILRQPTIYIASPANDTIYEIGNILLNFTINKPDTWESSVAISEIQYKLDPVFNGDFVTETSGWTDITPVQSSERIQQYSLTVKNASDGNHSLMVRVTTEYRGGYVTNGVYAFFSVIPAEPSPTESSSPSPTQQPTTEPSQTPDRPKIGDFAPVIIPASMILLAVIAVSILVYFSRRRGMKN